MLLTVSMLFEIPCAFLQGRIFFWNYEVTMETRIAIVSIIVEKPDAAAEVNNILHEYAGTIIGRMGLPYRQRNIGIISVVLDAPHNTISALSGKLGRIEGVNVQTLYSKSGTGA